MKTLSKEIVELGKGRKYLEELIEMGLLHEGCELWKRYKQVKRELAIHWNNLICD